MLIIKQILKKLSERSYMDLIFLNYLKANVRG